MVREREGVCKEGGESCNDSDQRRNRTQRA